MNTGLYCSLNIFSMNAFKQTINVYFVNGFW